MLVMAHATPLYRGAGYIERTYYSPGVWYTTSATHIVSKFPRVRAQPSSLSVLSQLADALSPLSVCSRVVPHVSENARRPTEPAHLSPRRAGDEKQIQ